MNLIDALPEGIQNMIEKSPEYIGAVGEAPGPMDDLEDDIPF